MAICTRFMTIVTPYVVYYANQTVNGLGQPTEYSLGNGQMTTKNYSNGQPTRFTTQNIQDISMGWNNSTGLTLAHRADNIAVTNETFDYDGLFRLKNYHASPNLPTNCTYDITSGTTRGNLEKDDVAPLGLGIYNYWMHELTSIKADPPTPVVATMQQNQQNITYTGFRQPASIIEGNSELDFTSYDADYQRKSTQLLQNGMPVETREYYGDWERITNTAAHTDYVVNYIGGGDGVCALSVIDISGCNITGPITVTIHAAIRGTSSYVTINNNCQVTPAIYYVYKDHLGSFLTLTDDQGIIKGQQNFDPWGRMRNPTDWSYNLTTNNYIPMPSWMTRGFTGQEHLPEFNLINLNARLYDPIVGRMLGPDKNIQDPNFTQDYNSYTYARNNPLKYTDPSGNVYKIAYDNPSNTNTNSNQQIWAFAIGIASMGIGGIVGDYIGGIAGYVIGGAVTGFIGGAGNALVGGANIGQALTAGAEMGGMATLSTGIGIGLAYGMNSWSQGANGNGEVYESESSSGGKANQQEYKDGFKIADDFNGSYGTEWDKLKSLMNTKPAYLNNYTDYSNEVVPIVPTDQGYSMSPNGLMISPKLDYVYATTIEDGLGKSTTYMSKYAIDFMSKDEFYGTLVHEMTHAYDIHLAFTLGYDWSSEQRRHWSEHAALSNEISYYNSINRPDLTQYIKDNYVKELSWGSWSRINSLGYIPPWLK